MATGADWSRIEVEACVADYLRMLTLELNGQRYSKAEHARVLGQALDGRSRASIEFKHCNISAVMQELGYPPINGYKARGNYQALLFDVLEAQLSTNMEVQAAAQAAAVRPAVPTTAENHPDPWVPAPTPTRHVRETQPEYLPRFSPAGRDYLAQEAQNRSLGRAGELFVLDHEARRLHAAGKKFLGNRVEHIAATQGDGPGYDVLSFDEDGQERLIEVKTTAFGQLTPFFVSRNELARSQADALSYRVYRLFDFRQKPRMFVLAGAIADHCLLDAVNYRATLLAR